MIPGRLRGLSANLGPLFLGLLLACARPPSPLPVRPPAPAPRAPVRVLPRLGFTLQAGAFAKVENAARFAQSLQAQGLEAAYYASGDGLYRVRFGDFPSRDKARFRGEALRSAGIIEAFWVVAPDGSGPAAPGLLRPHPLEAAGLRLSLVETARTYLGVPYLFGGTTERGFDCSGLTGAVYQLNGLRLPRNSRDQFEVGTPVELAQARPGDLLFFATKGPGRVSHVGMYVGRGAFIHAPSPGQGIREDAVTTRYYQQAFLGARSYL